MSEEWTLVILRRHWTYSSDLATIECPECGIVSEWRQPDALAVFEETRGGTRRPMRLSLVCSHTKTQKVWLDEWPGSVP